MMALLSQRTSVQKSIERRSYGSDPNTDYYAICDPRDPTPAHVSTQRFWIDYDADADVLYISFQHPQQATNTEMTDEGILVRYRGKDLVGITILDASTRHA